MYENPFGFIIIKYDNRDTEKFILRQTKIERYRFRKITIYNWKKTQ